MSDYELLPESPLGGVEIELEGFNITEVTDKSLVMVALPRDKFSEIESSIDKSCGLKLPEMENSTESRDSSITNPLGRNTLVGPSKLPLLNVKVVAIVPSSSLL